MKTMTPEEIDATIYEFQRFFKLGFVMLVMLLIVGCAPAKKMEKSSVTQKQQAQTEVSKNTAVKESGSAAAKTENNTDLQQKSTASVDEKSNESAKIHTINYDPNAPVDPKTNRRPVASETFQETTKNNDKKAVESTETLYSANEVTQLFTQYLKSYKSEMDSLSKVNTSLKSEVSTKTEQAGNWWKWLLLGISLPVIGWVIWKFTPWGNLSFFINKLKSKFVTENNK